MTGFPERVLKCHSLYFACGVCCALSFFELVFLFPVLMRAEEPSMWWLLIAATLCLFACFLSALQSWAVWRAREACAAIVYRFRQNGHRIDEQLKAHAQSADLLIAKLCSYAQCCYFAACLFLKAYLPPCSSSTTFTWVSDMEVKIMPCCVMLELFCMLFLVTNLVLATWVQCLPRMIQRVRRSLVPEGVVGLPKEVLELFHTYTFSGEAGVAAEGDESSSCMICMEDYKAGDTIRRLPCGHQFCAPCADGWLSAKPVCPMRCEENLWDTVRGLAKEAGLPEPVPV